MGKIKVKEKDFKKFSIEKKIKTIQLILLGIVKLEKGE